MSLNTTAVLDAIVSHALAAGLFDTVNSHEPKVAPGTGLACAIWADSIRPVPTGSGLQKTTALAIFNVRIYQNMLSEPQDAIDPAMINAVDALMTAYSGDFELGGNVRNIDLLGQTTFSLSAQAGYINQDGRLYRVMTIMLPVIINDAWSQSP